VFTFTVQPNIKMLIDQGCSPKILSQFRIFLPLEPITICVPVTKSSLDIPEKMILELLNQPWKIRSGEHMGQRGGTVSNLEKFMYQFPEDTWHNLVNRAMRQAKEKAKEALKDCSDLTGAKREIGRLIAGRRAECMYFGKDEQETEKEVAMYQNAWEAIRSSALVLDSLCFLKVIDNG
jgi:ATP-dependent helicase HepA